MLPTSKNVLFQGHHHLLTTSDAYESVREYNCKKTCKLILNQHKSSELLYELSMAENFGP